MTRVEFTFLVGHISQILKPLKQIHGSYRKTLMLSDDFDIDGFCKNSEMLTETFWIKEQSITIFVNVTAIPRY